MRHFEFYCTHSLLILCCLVLEGYDVDDPPLEGTARGTISENFPSEEAGPSHVSASEGMLSADSPLDMDVSEPDPAVYEQFLRDASPTPGMSFFFSLSFPHHYGSA